MPVTVRFPAFVWIAALLAGCAAAAASSSARVIVTMQAGAELQDPVALEREIARRTGVRIVYGAPISARAHAITVLCETADTDCASARSLLSSSGLFIDVSPDRRQRRQ